MDGLIPREPRQVAPGAVHLPDWLSLTDQRHLVRACRRWARPDAHGNPGMRATMLRGGGVMSVRTVCLGWHWYPYGYSRTVDRGDGRGPPVRPFPAWLAELGRRAVAEAYADPAAGAAYCPDVALVNHYDRTAKMGLHQDRDERGREPVVSLSLGDACLFRFGNTEHRNRPWVDLELRSGDLFVFGGPSRLAFHGVPKTYPGTGDPSIGLTEGRLNITLRVSGLRPCALGPKFATARRTRATHEDRGSTERQAGFAPGKPAPRSIDHDSETGCAGPAATASRSGCSPARG